MARYALEVKRVGSKGELGFDRVRVGTPQGLTPAHRWTVRGTVGKMAAS